MKTIIFLLALIALVYLLHDPEALGAFVSDTIESVERGFVNGSPSEGPSGR